MKKLNFILFAAAMVSLTSCLKDGPVNLAPGASPPVIEWSTAQLDDAPQNASTASFRLYKRAYPIAASVNMPLQVDLTGTDPAASDITVTVGISQTAYNTFVGTSTTNPILPAADYTMPTTVTIAKGTRDATVNIVLNTTLFDVTKTYYLPVTITATTFGGISANYGTVIYSVAAKNKYDGIYTVSGTMVDNAGLGITGKYPVKYYLETTGGSSVAMFDYLYAGTFGHEILSPGTSYYGSFSPTFTFDANNNVTSVVNYSGYGQPASNTRSAAIDPTGQNKFISGTPGVAGAVFQCSYFMYQPNTVAVGPRTTFNETFTYIGPRP